MLATALGPVMPLAGPAAVELRMRDALTGLARYSMILDPTDTTFRVHGLVQTVERIRAEADGAAAEARDRALTRLTDLFPYTYDEPAQWPLCRTLMPHQQTLLAHPFPESTTDRAPILLNLAANFLLCSGDAAGALPLFRRALESSERVLGPERPDTLSSVGNLAACMEDLGDAARALPLNRRALESRERVLGPEHPDTLSGVNNLAVCMEELGDAAGALPLYRRALGGPRARARPGASADAHQREQPGRMPAGAGRRGGGFAALRPDCSRGRASADAQGRARARGWLRVGHRSVFLSPIFRTYVLHILRRLSSWRSTPLCRP